MSKQSPSSPTVNVLIKVDGKVVSFCSVNIHRPWREVTPKGCMDQLIVKMIDGRECKTTLDDTPNHINATTDGVTLWMLTDNYVEKYKQVTSDSEAVYYDGVPCFVL